MRASSFYQQDIDKALRFGDVLRGLVLSTPKIEKPILVGDYHDYSVDVRIQELSVVLTPCCSIGENMITVAPLKPITSRYFENPFLAEKLTNINRKMTAQQAIHPVAWEKLSIEEREIKLNAPEAYAFASTFIYDEHESLPAYPVNRKREDTIQIRYYQIDFRDMYKVQCKAIISTENSPIEAKILQLSVFTRQELRNKMGWYFSRETQEDKAILEAQ